MFGRAFKSVRNQSIAFALAVAIAAFVSPAAAQSESSATGLQGTWRVQVNVINCSTGQNIGPAFSSMLTFAQGGTLTGTTRSSAFQPGQRTGDFGIWKYVGGNSFSADSEAFILFTSTAPPLFQSGTQRISQSIVLNKDTFESVAITRFYDTNRNLLSTGCAHAVATRFQ
jgi:hypothetical protein